MASASCRNLERTARAALRERGSSFGPATEALFDLVAASDLLPRTVPAGRLPKDFAARCLAVSRRRREALTAEAGALAAARTIERRSRSEEPLTRRATVRLARLAAPYPGDPEEGVAPGELALPGTPLVVSRTGTVHHRETVPGASILVGAHLVSRLSGLTSPSASNRAARERAADAARRLGRALAVVDAAWPEAGAEIRNRTRLVLPLDEPGLVSFSLLHRPGVTFINLRGKTLLDLADDLLHETAHHRLHAIEDDTPLFPKRKRGEEVRYWSPWRRAARPVRGIFHAAYTFSFRAELLWRIFEGLREKGGHPDRARHVRREALRERRMVARAVADLEDASRRGLLTPAGSRLLRRIPVETRRLHP